VVAFRAEHVKAVKEEEWQAQQESSRSRAIRRRRGGPSDGKCDGGDESKVDDKFWHVLTYKQKWYIDGEGYATSGYAAQDRHVSIDKFDWRDERPSTTSTRPPAGQPTINRGHSCGAAAQQGASTGGTSIHVGVSAVGDRWIGQFSTRRVKDS
jgi:hypothetical protein